MWPFDVRPTQIPNIEILQDGRCRKDACVPYASESTIQTDRETNVYRSICTPRTFGTFQCYGCAKECFIMIYCCLFACETVRYYWVDICTVCDVRSCSSRNTIALGRCGANYNKLTTLWLAINELRNFFHLTKCRWAIGIIHHDIKKLLHPRQMTESRFPTQDVENRRSSTISTFEK